ncbi:premnaspirodiene oxygenase-like [Coffea eugenioides]|uniref:Premnaspirodiene oxygenase-like n=1 Tax=Coffea arabica TaxID=13443 RepID=A0ABM4VCC5_COFAR|nr:premnaspirodiene oxygenase-like [Coffea eugenioides]XP_027184001.1 premnaspirodiene oxygenase-like [Coffea eugenioides]
MTCRAAFGGILKNNETMIEFLKKSVTLAGGFVAADFFASLKILPIISGIKGELLTMHHKIDAILDDVINQHKVNHESGKKGNAESGDEDLIDVLLRQQENGSLQIPITSQKIKADIFNTGTDTTSIVTEWAMSELMKNPKVMAKVQAEVRQVCKGKKTIEEEDIQKLTYLKMVVKETLRLHPPVPLIPRSNKEIKPRCQRVYDTHSC